MYELYICQLIALWALRRVLRGGISVLHKLIHLALSTPPAASQGSYGHFYVQESLCIQTRKGYLT